MNLFEYFECISSTKNDAYELLDDKTKSSFGFMLNRYMACEYPIHAHELNKNQVSGLFISEFWRKILIKKRYLRVPNFFYVKTSSKHSEEQKKIKPEILNKICQIEKIKKSDFLNYINNNPEKSITLIKEYEKIFKKE